MQITVGTLTFDPVAVLEAAKEAQKAGGVCEGRFYDGGARCIMGNVLFALGVSDERLRVTPYRGRSIRQEEDAAEVLMGGWPATENNMMVCAYGSDAMPWLMAKFDERIAHWKAQARAEEASEKFLAGLRALPPLLPAPKTEPV